MSRRLLHEMLACGLHLQALVFEASRNSHGYSHLWAKNIADMKTNGN
jgi:hypothetical protein